VAFSSKGATQLKNSFQVPQMPLFVPVDELPDIRAAAPSSEVTLMARNLSIQPPVLGTPALSSGNRQTVTISWIGEKGVSESSDCNKG
jgi:hypothetical protein